MPLSHAQGTPDSATVCMGMGDAEATSAAGAHADKAGGVMAQPPAWDRSADALMDTFLRDVVITLFAIVVIRALYAWCVPAEEEQEDEEGEEDKATEAGNADAADEARAPSE